jgi:hypothetical protein
MYWAGATERGSRVARLALRGERPAESQVRQANVVRTATRIGPFDLEGHGACRIGCRRLETVHLQRDRSPSYEKTPEHVAGVRIRLRHGHGSIGESRRDVQLAAGLGQERLLGRERGDSLVPGGNTRLNRGSTSARSCAARVRSPFARCNRALRNSA